MPIFELSTHDLSFPPAYLADKSGILAIGGDLSPERLLSAYIIGVFPWFNPDEPILWWCPDPRMVLLPSKLKISKSMRPMIRKNEFRVSVNECFKAVMQACKETYRPSQGYAGSWISGELIDSFQVLHRLGYAHSVEIWHTNQLVGGLYGIILGKCFFGESMFSTMSNASKLAFVALAKNLERLGFELIDCQVETEHLASLGAENMSRQHFLEILRRYVSSEPFDLKQHFETDLVKLILTPQAQTQT